MKFCQLIEWKIRNNLLWKSYTKYDGETSTRPLSKKSKFSLSPDQ